MVSWVLLALSVLASSSLFVGAGAKKLQGVFPGNAEWIHGYGRKGEAMVYCPTNCSGNLDFGTHLGTDPEYFKMWDMTGWTEPIYSKDTDQEIAAGLKQGDPDFIQSGVSVLCKKPYDVCDYPNGDVYVRAALELLLQKTDSLQCQSSMKTFLCALYRRKCGTNTDPDRFSPTYRMRAILPVCWSQCWDSYIECGYGRHHATLMCSEYIKAGWVEYDYQGRLTGCDNKGVARSPESALLSVDVLTGISAFLRAHPQPRH